MTWKQNQMNDTPIPKGKVKIRILDKDKNIKQEVSGENYISEEFKHWFYKNAIANIFVEGHQSGGTLLNNFSKRLWLTDYDGEENPDDPYMRGNIIGWANMSGTYSGGNFMQGGVNAKRTGNPSFEGVKIYIDFPFDFGVGENINSVYITLRDHSVSGKITRSREGFYSKRYWLIPFEDGYLTRDYDDSDYIQKLNSTMQKSGEKIRSTYNVSRYNAIWHNGALYGCRDNIKKLKQLGSSDYETIVKGYARLSGLVKCQNRIFSTGRKDSSLREGIIEFDSNFNEIGHYPFPEFNGSLPSDYNRSDYLWYDEKWGVVGGRSWTFDINTKTFSYHSGSSTGGMRFKEGVAIEDHSSSLVWQPMGNYISRFKLPEPITKKPEDYMQVVYEYQFDPECLFPFPEDWLDS